jgi:hypothetical protein
MVEVGWVPPGVECFFDRIAEEKKNTNSFLSPGADGLSWAVWRLVPVVWAGGEWWLCQWAASLSTNASDVAEKT